LGRGGMGEVYRADDLKLRQPVALKFLLNTDSSQLEALYTEVRQARKVSDRHLCRIHDIGEAGGQPFLSMELIEGEHLGSLLRRIGRLPTDKGIELARQLCAGMAVAHQEGLLHLDLKPSNLMINQGGDLVITDFGLSLLSREAGEERRRSGTPAYMAPEHLLDGQVSEQSDIFAIGLILHEMFTGERFHADRSVSEIADWYRRERSAPTMSRVAPRLAPELDELVSRCLEIVPARRAQSVAELVKLLDAIKSPAPSLTDLAKDLSSGSGKTLAALLFTDIVGSVELQQSLGTDAYTRLVAYHDRTFKECLDASSGAAILNETGDGFLVRFADPTEATKAALRLQSRLAREVVEGRRLQIRMGLHLGLITEMTDSLRGDRRAVGMAINLASRVMSLGEAGQILMTRAVYDDAR
ncbi:MAG: protein kinase, partial [Akkermansiaceae bacterium]|nr:protein kinase [Akkermansiaceae bacterium]